MSSRPGVTLEDFVENDCWLIVTDNPWVDPDSNYFRLTKAEFQPILALFEPYREHIEHTLYAFDEDTQNWRDYAFSSFDYIPDDLYKKAFELINELRNERG